MNERKNSSALASIPTRRQLIAGTGLAFGGLALGFNGGLGEAVEEISHTAESIHQEPVFRASRKRVYEALTDAKQFTQGVLLSNSYESGHGTREASSTEISPEAGGAFSLFGGYVDGTAHRTCNQMERIVQAWRAGGWIRGSIRLRSLISWSKAR